VISVRPATPADVPAMSQVLVASITDLCADRRALLPLARLLTVPMRLLPAPPLTADQVILLQRDNVVSAVAESAGLTLQRLGIEPVALEAVLPRYLWRFRPHGQFDKAPA
jgi:hypothetical protein